MDGRSDTGPQAESPTRTYPNIAQSFEVTTAIARNVIKSQLH